MDSDYFTESFFVYIHEMKRPYYIEMQNKKENKRKKRNLLVLFSELSGEQSSEVEVRKTTGMRKLLPFNFKQSH